MKSEPLNEPFPFHEDSNPPNPHCSTLNERSIAKLQIQIDEILHHMWLNKSILLLFFTNSIITYNKREKIQILDISSTQFIRILCPTPQMWSMYYLLHFKKFKYFNQ